MEYSPLISAQDISAAYDHTPVWEHASFTVNQGEFVAVIGPNGAGKTTLFQILLGLKKPSAGTISVFGELPRRGDARIGYVPQHHPMDKELNLQAIELVMLGLDGHRFGFRRAAKGRKQALDALRVVEAEHLAAKPLGTMSGGELQRVFFAEALIGKPHLILMDEPLANLDIKHGANLIQLINSIVRTHSVTVLLIDHNINPMIHVLDSIMYIANGRIATGTPDAILTPASLSALYGTNVEVLKDSQGRVAILGIEEHIPHIQGHEHDHDSHHNHEHHAHL